jgi:hypothetical protein
MTFTAPNTAGQAAEVGAQTLRRATIDEIGHVLGQSRSVHAVLGAVARAVDVRHKSQMSRQIARLGPAGGVRRPKHGRSNAWQLTARGHDAVRSVNDAQQSAAGDAR